MAMAAAAATDKRAALCEAELLLEEGAEEAPRRRPAGRGWARPLGAALAACAAAAVLLCLHAGPAASRPSAAVGLAAKGGADVAANASPDASSNTSANATSNSSSNASSNASGNTSANTSSNTTSNASSNTSSNTTPGASATTSSTTTGHAGSAGHGKHTEEEKAVAAPVCTSGSANCNVTGCCAEPGMQCYAQNELYAQCREACTPGPDPSHWDGQWWTCQELGERTPGSHTCSAPGEDCRQTKCCTHVNTQCFEKHAGWATCKSQCTPGGPDLSDADPEPWTCKALGPWKTGAMPWVGSECAADGEDCRSKKCCKESGHQCYSQSEYWAQCKPACTPGKDPVRSWEPEWSCNTSGYRTPEGGLLVPGKVSGWVAEKCAGFGEGCSDSKCCKAVGHICYEKNKNWATCMEQCTEGVNAADNNETWSCRQLGPVSVGLALKAFPSLFCWSLMRTTGYEMGLMQNALGKGAGIFACDGFSVLSTDEPTEMGTTPDGVAVTTVQVPPAEITTSQDGTSGNSKLFINCWDAVMSDGRWRYHAWMIKADPDAVMFPDRVRTHLAPHVNENVYVVNCNKFPSSPNFPMMYGALEIFSVKAIDVYSRNKGLCFSDMGSMLPRWGEDYFMTHCLDHIGVGRISDFGSLGDMMCTGANCGDGWVASFHPFKDVDSWNSCFDTATR